MVNLITIILIVIPSSFALHDCIDKTLPYLRVCGLGFRRDKVSPDWDGTRAVSQCCDYSTLRTCVHDVLRRKCDKEITQWPQKNRLDAIVDTVTSSFVTGDTKRFCDQVSNRDLDDACIPSWTAILICVLIILIALFTICCLCGLVHRAKKARVVSRTQAARSADEI